ncbi:MAG: triose-phosphate isomerase, partial [bacterium]|nr:triose-phosphate isomerase [bacterium]
MNKIIIANWKSNPKTLEEAQELFRTEVAAADRYLKVRTVICPPPAFLEKLAQIDQSYLGAQDIEIAETLKNFGVSHVLIGHSDRRYGLGETDEVVNKKIKD